MAILITDTFTEGSTIDLASHTPEVGGTWVDHPHANYTVPFQVDASTDRIFSIGTAAYYNSTDLGTADYYVQADFQHVSTISQNIAVCARMDQTADTMYIVRFNSGTTWEMRKIIAGVATTLTGGTTTNQLPSVGSFKTGKFVVQGDQLSFYINGVLEIGPITDTAITAAGRAGVRNAGVASATTGMHIDNFEAGDLVVVTSRPSFRVNSLRPAIFKPGRAR